MEPGAIGPKLKRSCRSLPVRFANAPLRILVNPYAGLRGLPRSVWVLCAATFVNRMGAMASPFLALYATEALGYSAARAGGLLAVFGAGTILSAPLGGWLSDRIGARRVLAGALAGTAALLVPFPLVAPGAALVAVVFAWALVGEMGRPSSMAVLAESAPPETMRAATAAYRLALNLGMSVGPPVGGLLAAVSFPLLFRLNAASAFVAAIVVAVWLGGRGRARPVAADGARGGAWRDGRLLAFCAGFGLVWAAFVLQFGPLSIHVVGGMGHTPGVYGALVAVNTLLIVFFDVPLTLRLRAWPLGRVFAVGGVLVAVGLALLAFERLDAIAVGVAVAAFGEMLVMGAAVPFVAGLAPQGRGGAYMGAYSLAAGVGMSLGPWLGAVALGELGARPTWLLGALAALAGTALAVRAMRPAETAGSAT